ncbi:hypothetical protein ACFQT0_30785 [Hymenobacter humi]|uniref:Uncharacterized protein n=1 Tax=Hymenobacter humi TaxID=1411620 RepID=A0ABW2UCN5_9BACT
MTPTCTAACPVSPGSSRRLPRRLSARGVLFLLPLVLLAVAARGQGATLDAGLR